MSHPIDIRLADPTDDAIIDALDRANKRLSSSHERSRWRVLLDEIADNAEGRSQLEHSRPDDYGARYLSCAWWTDHRGSKYVRVCGGDTAVDGWHPHYSQLDHDIRPPLWHVFGERVYRVTKPGQPPRWVVSCACGETGEPRSLAWMGLRCGPCHDRREDGEVDDEVTPTILKEYGTGYAVAFAPDGMSLATSSFGRTIKLHDLRDGEHRMLYSDEATDPREELRPLCFSPDGRFLAVGDTPEWQVRIWDLDHDDSAIEEWLPGDGTDGAVSGLAFSPDSRLLAACTTVDEPIIWARDGRQFEGVWRPAGNYSALAFSPAGGTLALWCADGVLFYTVPAWDPIGGISFTQDEAEVYLLQYTPDGKRLVCVTESAFSLSGASTCRLHLRELETDAEPRTTTVPARTRAAALSPDGRYFASIVHDDLHSPGEILFWDLLQWSEAGRLEWNPEDALNDLAFSPDGHTLATISAAGVVKLWPWRLLLEG